MQNQQATKGQLRKMMSKGTMGGVNDIQAYEILIYVKFLLDSERPPHNRLVDSVDNLKKVVNQHPIIRGQLNLGLLQIKDPNDPLYNGDKTQDQRLQYFYTLLSQAVITPPSYSNAKFVGVPLYSIVKGLCITDFGRIFFGHDKINNCLKKIFDEYCTMLLSKKSVKYLNNDSPTGWFCDAAKQEVGYQDFQCYDHKDQPNWGFKNWNQWFLRLPKPDKRPINLDDNTIAFACQNTPISYPFMPVTNVKAKDTFYVKDAKYSLSDMLGNHPRKQYYIKQFEGGTVYQGFLSPLNYHRWNSPVNGTIEENYLVQGTYYLDYSFYKGDLTTTEVQATVDCQPFLTIAATRRVTIIKADNPLIGKICCIMVGMAQVSSCVSVVSIGDKVKKGDELGYFMFGGSTHAIIFNKQISPKLYFNTEISPDGKQHKKVECKEASYNISYLYQWKQVTEDKQKEIEEYPESFQCIVKKNGNKFPVGRQQKVKDIMAIIKFD